MAARRHDRCGQHHPIGGGARVTGATGYRIRRGWWVRPAGRLRQLHSDRTWRNLGQPDNPIARRRRGHVSRSGGLGRRLGVRPRCRVVFGPWLRPEVFDRHDVQRNEMPESAACSRPTLKFIGGPALEGPDAGNQGRDFVAVVASRELGFWHDNLRPLYPTGDAVRGNTPVSPFSQDLYIPYLSPLHILRIKRVQESNAPRCTLSGTPSVPHGNT
jgi:hypothetical protein